MKVCTFLTDGFETVEALAVVDILRRAGITTDTISITGNKDVLSAQNISVKADCLFDEYEFNGDEMLFLPGGPGHKNYYECEKLLDMLKEYNANDRRIAAICAAPSILGNLYILDGRKATCFPGFESQLKGAEVFGAPAKVITDGNVTTSRGMGTAIDLGLEIVKLILGEDEAQRIGKNIQYL